MGITQLCKISCQRPGCTMPMGSLSACTPLQPDTAEIGLQLIIMEQGDILRSAQLSWPAVLGPCSAKLSSPTFSIRKVWIKYNHQYHLRSSLVSGGHMQPNSGGDTSSFRLPLAQWPGQAISSTANTNKDFQAHLVPGSPQGNMQCGAVLSHVEVLAAKHAIDLFLQLRLLRQGYQQLQPGHRVFWASFR